MFELAVISGKGGTGKTSLTAALAVLAGKNLMVDCDVDAANLSLVLNNKIEETHEFIASRKASINRDICNDCGECLEYCRFDAIKQAEAGFQIDPMYCEGCGVCRLFCPQEAIDFKPVKSGEWFLSGTPYGPLIHARLGIAQSNSGRLVSLLRKQAKELAEKNGSEFIIIDGPPGIGCPVIASITGTGFVLVVTEPSLSAFHDLQRVLELIKHFSIACGVCINKFDINIKISREIEKYAQQNNVPVLGKISFDPAVTKAQVDGLSFIENSDTDTGSQVISLWENIKEEISKLKKYQFKLNVINK